MNYPSFSNISKISTYQPPTSLPVHLTTKSIQITHNIQTIPPQRELEWTWLFSRPGRHLAGHPPAPRPAASPASISLVHEIDSKRGGTIGPIAVTWLGTCGPVGPMTAEGAWSLLRRWRETAAGIDPGAGFSVVRAWGFFLGRSGR